MDSAPFSFSANIIGVATGSLSVLGLFLAFYRAHLPSPRFKSLEELLKDTESIYDSTIEANLLRDGRLQEDIQIQLIQLRNDVYAHRRRAYGATGLLQQYKEFFKGLSFAISRTAKEVQDLRALIIISSEVGMESLDNSVDGFNRTGPISEDQRPEDIIRPQGCSLGAAPSNHRAEPCSSFPQGFLPGGNDQPSSNRHGLPWPRDERVDVDKIVQPTETVDTNSPEHIGFLSRRSSQGSLWELLTMPQDGHPDIDPVAGSLESISMSATHCLLPVGNDKTVLSHGENNNKGWSLRGSELGRAGPSAQQYDPIRHGLDDTTWLLEEALETPFNLDMRRRRSYITSGTVDAGVLHYPPAPYGQGQGGELYSRGSRFGSTWGVSSGKRPSFPLSRLRFGFGFATEKDASIPKREERRQSLATRWLSKWSGSDANES